MFIFGVFNIKPYQILKKLLSVLYIFLPVLVFMACAKIGSPPGGDKDEVPPVPLKSSPANYATGYDQKKIKITFDEFIKLDNAFTEFTVSPPLEEKPMPLVRGKAIIISLPASDIDSLTYTLDFGQAIEDVNESNKLPNFQFVVSKMPYIDSFSVSGKVLDAYTKLADQEPFYVLLNNNLHDTAFSTVIPTYLGRTNPKGEFNINHIAPGTYNVFALKDANSNLIYDLPSEAIAFADEPITLHPDSFDFKLPLYDTVLADTSYPVLDSLAVDSSFFTGVNPDSLADSTDIVDSMDIMVYGYSFNMFSFLVADPFNLYLEEFERKEPEKLSMFFSEAMDSVPKVKLLFPDTTGIWYYLEKNRTNDTLHYWLADSNLVFKDSIIVEIKHHQTDTLGELSMTTDTLLFRYTHKKKEEEKSKGGGLLSKIGIGEGESAKDTLPEPVPRMSLKNNINRSLQDLNANIKFVANAPVVEYNKDLIKLYFMQDTIEKPVGFEFLRDSSNMRTFWLKTNYEPTESYRLKLHEGAFTDIYSRTIDSTVIGFITQRDDFYGIVNLNIENVNTPSILEFMDDSEKVLKTVLVDSAQRLRFDFLHPGKYMFRIIYDLNENKEWDTGNYEEFLQPEQVEYYPNMLEVRSNWEVEYTWELPDTITEIRPKEAAGEKDNDKK